MFLKTSILKNLIVLGRSSNKKTNILNYLQKLHRKQQEFKDTRRQQDEFSDVGDSQRCAVSHQPVRRTSEVGTRGMGGGPRNIRPLWLRMDDD